MKRTRKSKSFKVVVLLTASAVVAAASGCGAMLTGVTGSVALNTDPPGAEATVRDVGGVEVAKTQTPNTVELKKKKSYQVNFAKPGYQSKSAMIQSKVSVGMVILDCLWILAIWPVGIIAIVTDAGTGGWNSIQGSVSVQLDKEAGPPAPSPASPPEPPGQL